MKYLESDITVTIKANFLFTELHCNAISSTPDCVLCGDRGIYGHMTSSHQLELTGGGDADCKVNSACGHWIATHKSIFY